MSDLEQRLTDALTERRRGRAGRRRTGVRGPGPGPPQATQPHRGGRCAGGPRRRGAQRRGRLRRRRRAGPGRPPAGQGETAVDPTGDGDGQDSVPALADGYRWESWHDVTSRCPTPGSTAASATGAPAAGRSTPRASSGRGPWPTTILCDPGLDVRHHLPGDRQPRRLPVAGGPPGRGRLAGRERRRWPRHRWRPGHGCDPHHRAGGGTSWTRCARSVRDGDPNGCRSALHAGRGEPAGGRALGLPVRRDVGARAERGAGRRGRRCCRARSPGRPRAGASARTPARAASPTRSSSCRRRYVGHGGPRGRLPPRDRRRRGPRAHPRRPLLGAVAWLEWFRSGRRLTTV